MLPPPWLSSQYHLTLVVSRQYLRLLQVVPPHLPVSCNRPPG